MQHFILVFNYNYAHFMESCLKSLMPFCNKHNYHVVVLDDGSADDSYEIFDKIKCVYGFNNLSLQKTRVKNAKRRAIPSHGQIDGLSIFLNKYDVNDTDFIFLLDCDDYYAGDIVNLDLRDEKLDLVLLNVRNLHEDTNNIIDLKVKRGLNDGVSYLWPTIVPTSGLIIRARFLRKYREKLLGKQSEFRDIWLDLRINICAMHKGTEVRYGGGSVIRRLHSSNDSAAGGLFRMFLRQLNAYAFRQSIYSLDSAELSFRSFFTILALNALKLLKFFKSRRLL